MFEILCGVVPFVIDTIHFPKPCQLYAFPVYKWQSFSCWFSSMIAIHSFFFRTIQNFRLFPRSGCRKTHQRLKFGRKTRRKTISAILRRILLRISNEANSFVPYMVGIEANSLGAIPWNIETYRSRKLAGQPKHPLHRIRQVPFCYQTLFNGEFARNSRSLLTLLYREFSSMIPSHTLYYGENSLETGRYNPHTITENSPNASMPTHILLWWIHQIPAFA